MSSRHSHHPTTAAAANSRVGSSTPASAVHRVSASAKLVGLLLFVTAVAITPRDHVGAFIADAIMVGIVVGLAKLSPRYIARRLVVLIPFVATAAFLPFIAQGGRYLDVGGLSLSQEGAWAAWNIIAKASLGASASIIVSATTPTTEIIAGLSRLRVPAVVVAIVSFMFRYLETLGDELARMRLAMVARGYDPRWLWQVRPVASSAGALFVRSYERGERVHQAMAARGFTGTMPPQDDSTSSRHGRVGEQCLAVVPGIVACLALVVSVLA